MSDEHISDSTLWDAMLTLIGMRQNRDTCWEWAAPHLVSILDKGSIDTDEELAAAMWAVSTVFAEMRVGEVVASRNVEAN